MQYIVCIMHAELLRASKMQNNPQWAMLLQCIESHAVCMANCRGNEANSAMCERQVNIPLWALVHLPVVVTITTAVFTPKGWLHCILYVLFENAMGIVKLWAVIAGQPTLPLQHLLMTLNYILACAWRSCSAVALCCHDRVFETAPPTDTFHAENLIRSGAE